MSVPTGYTSLLSQQAEQREELHKLVDKLDYRETQIVTEYVANLLLANVKPEAPPR